MRKDFQSGFLVASVILILIALPSCSSSASETNTLEESESPEITCQSEPASWRGIIPGQSTVEDVINLLGEPILEGNSVPGVTTFLYPPVLSTSTGDYGNLIVFRDDGIVKWIDVWVADSDGQFHTIAEIVQRYGTTLDRVYVNREYDVFGPDQIYVWSHCGIAVSAVGQGLIQRFEGEVLPLVEVTGVNTSQLDFRHPVHPQASVQPDPGVNDIIFRKFLFQPTSYTAFDELYADVIPYFSDNRFHKLRLADIE